MLQLLLAIALTWSGGAGGAERWRPDVAGAAAWAHRRDGSISFAVRTPGRIAGRAIDRRYPSASVIKAMLLVTYVRQGSVRDRPLRADERALLDPMIRSSDNDAASAVRNLVGDRAILRLARAAGMKRFTLHPAWGLSLITARDQTRFFMRLERLLPDRHRAYAMRLLRRIVPWQRWGIARTIPKGWRLYFKGGWGDEPGDVNHQIGLLRRGRHRVAIAVLTIGNPTHEYGRATLEGISRRLVRGLGPQLRGTAGRVRSFLRPRSLRRVRVISRTDG